MAKIVLAIIAVVASFMLVDSLSCNKCNFGIVGFCLTGNKETCSTNSSVCYTGKATFPSVSSFSGFNSQGCLDVNTTCNTSTNSTLLGVSYTLAISCCSTDNCNPITTSGAPSAKITLSAAIAAAVLASAWGSML